MTQFLTVTPNDFKNLDAVEIKMTLSDEHKPGVSSVRGSRLTVGLERGEIGLQSAD